MRIAFGVLAFLMFSVTIGACLGCISSGARADVPILIGNVDSQKAAAIHVVVHCTKMELGEVAWGSGVAVTKFEVLTAAHVVDCIGPRGPKGEPGKSLGEVDGILGIQPDGIGRPMKVVSVFAGTDVARLRFADDGEFYDIAPARIAGVAVGQRVCIVTAAPNRDRRCGEVEDVIRKRAAHDIAISTPVEPGNSGAGVYDQQGRLVGIVTQRRALENGQSVGGLMSGLGGREFVTYAEGE